MRTALFVLFAVIAPNLWAAEFVFRDLDCQVMGPDGSTVKVTKGDTSEQTCVVIGNEAVCNYKNIKTGKIQGQPTKFEVLDLGGAQLWSSLGTGNVKMLIDEEEKKYQYGMTAVIVDRGTILSKQCVGSIVRQVK